MLYINEAGPSPFPLPRTPDHTGIDYTITPPADVTISPPPDTMSPQIKQPPSRKRSRSQPDDHSPYLVRFVRGRRITRDTNRIFDCVKGEVVAECLQHLPAALTREDLGTMLDKQFRGLMRTHDEDRMAALDQADTQFRAHVSKEMRSHIMGYLTPHER